MKTIAIILFWVLSETVMVIASPLTNLEFPNSASTEQVVKILESNQFVVKANSIYSKDENRTYSVDPECNYFLVNDDKCIIHVTNNERPGFYEIHKITDVKIKIDKRGNVFYSALLKDSWKTIRLKMKICKKSNEFEARFTSLKNSGNYTFIGDVISDSISDVVKLF